MLTSEDLFPKSFDWKKYMDQIGLPKIVNFDISNSKIDLQQKIIYPPNFSVDPNNKIPFPPEFDDLCRLHYLASSRKVTTILEFGIGKSTPVLGNALSLNKEKYLKYTSKELRRGNLYECHSIDNCVEWIEKCMEIIPKRYLDEKFNNLHLSEVSVSEFYGRVCTFYDPIPNICPDLIYLDAPDLYSPKGNLRGLSTSHIDRVPMTGDILSFEHFLHPGTLIVVDGRTANSRFLKSNLQRNWAYFYSPDWDQHFFELQEQPLGIYNKRMLEHCLGQSYFNRISLDLN